MEFIHLMGLGRDNGQSEISNFMSMASQSVKKFFVSH